MAETYRLKPGEKPPTTGPNQPAKSTPPTPAPSPGPGRRPPTGSAGGPPAEAKTSAPPQPLPTARLASLDAYRGCIMILLAASGFGIASFAALPPEAPVWHRPIAAAGESQPAGDAEAETRRAWWERLAFHFDHPAWRSDFLMFNATDPRQESVWKRWGVSLWDLIQPAFMFMVGVAMPFSFRRRQQEGQSRWSRFGHAAWRAALLVLIGVFLYTRGGQRTNWVFTNVLAQIGLGYFFVYLMLGWKPWQQGLAAFVILAGYWGAMQYVDWRPLAGAAGDGANDFAAVGADPDKGEVLSGRFAPWSKNANLAHAVDVWLLNRLADPDAAAMTAWREKMQSGALSAGERLQMTVRRCLFANTEGFRFNRGGYQTLNFIPSMATMLLGVMCGGVLLRPVGSSRKLMILLGGALFCLVLGRVAGVYLCPIVKRIWTPSWTLFSGGYVIALLALFYLLFDVLPFRKLAWPAVIVGMNSLAMYLMGQLLGPFVRERVIQPHLTGLLETIFRTDPVVDGEYYRLADAMFGRLILPCTTLLIFWWIALWLWRRKIFIRL